MKSKPKQWGQPRPYADHRYEGVITFRGENGKWEPDENEVRKVAKAVFVNWSDDPEWYDARLKELTQLSGGSWQIVVTQPFLD